MQLIYDDMLEFFEVSQRCADNVKNDKCKYCVFYDRCQIDDTPNRHIFCGTIIDNGSISSTNPNQIARNESPSEGETNNASEWQKMS